MAVTTSPATTAARRDLLGLALRLDAVVTGVNAVAYLAAAGPLADLLGVPASILRIAGAGLLVFAAFVWRTAARPTRGAALAVVAVNALWVLDSALVAAAGVWSPETAGTAWIALQALTVAGLAALQVAGLRQADRT
jgi:hypothetical protein